MKDVVLRASAFRFALLPAVILALLLSAGCGKEQARTRTVGVPLLAGLTLEEARQVLAESGLQLGDVEEAFSDTQPEGRVISSEPPAKNVVEEGTAVDVVVSRGPESMLLSDVRGKPEGEATAFLQAQGLQVEVRRVYDESAAAGVVTGMDPAPGTAVAKGSLVTITVSAGSAYTTCRNCGGKGTVTVTEPCPECGGTGLCPT